MTEPHIRELEIKRAEALGHLLGMIDMVILARDVQDFIQVAEAIETLRVRRAEYSDASNAYLDARLNVGAAP